MLLNCGLGEGSWESLGLQGDPPVHPKGDQSWLFFGRNNAKAETPVLWPPQVKSWVIRKDSNAGRNWEQEEKGTTEDEMAGWHHWLNGRESKWTPGVGDGQGGLACCNSWGRKESDKMVHILLKPGLKNFEHYFASVWDECNCVIVWALFGIAFLWDWNENWALPVQWPLLSFPNLLAYLVQHFHSIILQDLK